MTNPDFARTLSLLRQEKGISQRQAAKALGISQATDAFAIVVSEETGNISVAHHGRLSTRLSSTELEKRLSHLSVI